ncbi:ABC transporter permease [Bradyrhizobium sp. WSM2254]|uniref:ABC transporter permease n=1 Tax=Bradyrhizobium TaxID=374 RepID=UPI000485229A|nr:ABC transporter permease [Bradyrhizobium sp. WSM2254]
MSVRYILTKLCRAFATLLFVVTFAFGVLRLAGDPIQMLLPSETPLDVVTAYRTRWGLDQSLSTQYLTYLSGLLHGDFGTSFREGRPAFGIVVERIPKTLELGLAGLLVALVIGIPAGCVAAINRGRLIDRAVMSLAVMGHSIPTFFLGILLILVFGSWLRLLPSAGSAGWSNLIMPAITVGTWNGATVARFTRSAMVDALEKSYMRTAIANGIPFWMRLRSHALPNAAIPIVTIVGLLTGQVLGGAVVVETVFAWPGVGRLTVAAVAAREISVVQTVVILAASTVITANLLVDVAYGFLDPRIGGRSIGARNG